MESEQQTDPGNEELRPTDSQFTGEAEMDDNPAWEQVAAGRYMPRRIKGSCKGRALG